MPESPDPRAEPMAPRTLLPLPTGRLTVILLALVFLALALTAGLAAVMASAETADGAPPAAGDDPAHVL